MTVLISIDPELGISAETLATAWNNDADATALGIAQVDSSDSAQKSFSLDLITTTAIISGAVGVGFGALSHVIHKLLDRLWEGDKKTSTSPPTPPSAILNVPMAAYTSSSPLHQPRNVFAQIRRLPYGLGERDC